MVAFLRCPFLFMFSFVLKTLIRKLKSTKASRLVGITKVCIGDGFVYLLNTDKLNKMEGYFRSVFMNHLKLGVVVHA